MSKPVKTYAMVRARDDIELAEKVQAKIEEGWQPLGGPAQSHGLYDPIGGLNLASDPRVIEYNWVQAITLKEKTNG